MAVKNDSSLVIDYTLTNTTDNKVVSSGETWGIQLGRGTMLSGFESGMVGMTVDETKNNNTYSSKRVGRDRYK